MGWPPVTALELSLSHPHCVGGWYPRPARGGTPDAGISLDGRDSACEVGFSCICSDPADGGFPSLPLRKKQIPKQLVFQGGPAGQACGSPSATLSKAVWCRQDRSPPAVERRGWPGCWWAMLPCLLALKALGPRLCWELLVVGSHLSSGAV